MRKWRRDTKILVYVHGEEVPHGSGYFNGLRLQALQSASALVAVSSFTKNALVEAGIPAQRITVITNGVDTARFQPVIRASASSTDTVSPIGASS